MGRILTSKKHTIQYAGIDEITPYSNNPRLNDDSVPFVRNSIERFGFLVPMVLDGNKTIVAGHTRWKAAKELGLKEVPYIDASYLTDDEIIAFRLADNQVGANSGYDFDLLDEELEKLKDGWNMEDFNFNMSVFDNLFDQEEEEEDVDIMEDMSDYIGDIPDSVKEGDVAVAGNGKVFCMTIDDALIHPEMPNGVDCVIWDYHPLNDQYISMLPTSSKPMIIVTTVPQMAVNAISAFERSGYILRAMMPWVRATGRSEQCGLLSMYQQILIFSAKNVLDAEGQDVIQAPSDTYTNLTGTKPLSYEAFVSLSVTFGLTKGMTVLDTNGATGSVFMACEKLGLQCFAVDQNPKNCSRIISMCEKARA